MDQRRSTYTCSGNGELFDSRIEGAVPALGAKFLGDLAPTTAQPEWVRLDSVDVTDDVRDQLDHICGEVEQFDELAERVGRLVWGIAHEVSGISSAERETWAQYRLWLGLVVVHRWRTSALIPSCGVWAHRNLLTGMATPGDVALWIRANFEPPGDADPTAVPPRRATMSGVPDPFATAQSFDALAATMNLEDRPARASGTTRVRTAAIDSLALEARTGDPLAPTRRLYLEVLPRLHLFARLYTRDDHIAVDRARLAFLRTLHGRLVDHFERRAFTTLRQSLLAATGSWRSVTLQVTTPVTGLDESGVKTLVELGPATAEVFVLRHRCGLDAADTASVLGVSRRDVDYQERSIRERLGLLG